MDLIERLKKKKIINEDNTFNPNKDEYSNETINRPNREITKYNSNIPNYANMNKIDTREINKNAFRNMPQKVQQVGSSYIRSGDLWDNVKQLAENNMKKNNIALQDVVRSLNYQDKKLGSGLLQGITGIGQTFTTEVANNLDKGSKANIGDLTKNTINSIMNTILPSPIATIPNINRLKDQYKILTDKDKNVTQKIVALATDGVSSAVDTIPGKPLIDSTVQNIGKIKPDLKDKAMEINNVISQPSKELNEKLAKEEEKQGEITKALGNAWQSVGNMLPSFATTMVTKNPNIGLAVMGVSAKGQSTQEALDRGAELNEAVKIGNTKAMIEIGTEKLFGGINIFGKGAIDDIIQRGIVDKVKNKVAKELVQRGINATGEVLEETISDVLGTYIDRGTVDPNATYTVEDFKDTAITTILTTLVLNFLSGGIGENISKNRTQSSQLNQKNIQNNIGDILENKTLQNAVSEQINEIPTKYMQNQANIQNNIQEQQINQAENKMSQNQMSEQINNNVQNYQYEATNNKKINNLRQDMSKYWTDTNETKALGSVIEKLITDKGYNVRLDNTINKDGAMANAQIKTLDNGEVEIRINPNAKNVGEFLLMHEVTHSIATQEMKDLVIDYVSKNQEFNKSLQNLKETYKTEDVSDEVLAEISGELFGYQEFINNLSMEKPNVFKRIYNKIIEWANKITGNSKEGLFIRDLKNKWEEAYRTQNNNLNGNTYYSIQQDTNGNRYVKVDTDQDIFEGIDKKDYNKIAKMYMQDYLMGKTTLSNNDSAIIDSKSASKYTNPQQRTSYMSEKMQLTPELKNVLEIAEKDSISLPTKENSKYKSWEYYKFKFTLGQRNFEGTINIGIDKDGNKHFYEINKIRFTGISSVSTNSQHKTDSINNSILPTKENVNRNTNNQYMQENKNNSETKNSLPTREWQKHLKENFKSTGTRTNLEDIKLPTKEYIDNKGNYVTNKDYEVLNKAYEKNNKQILENKQQTMYNNAESESDINGHNSNEQRGIKNIYQEENRREQGQGSYGVDDGRKKSIMGSENKNDAETQYKEFEQQARQNQLTNITKESRQVKDVAKRIYNKDIIHYDDNKTLFGGGLSKIDNTSILFGKNTVDNYGDSFLLGHEIGEDMLKNYRDRAGNIYYELSEKIQNDANFGDIFLDYIFDMDENLKNNYIEHPEKIAKELICDTLGFMQNNNELGNNLPYKEIKDVWINKLDVQLQNEMKQVLRELHDDIYTNKKMDLTTKHDIKLPTKEYIDNKGNYVTNKEKPTRHDVIQQNREEARKNIENISTWKDKKNGLRYQMEIMERNMYDIIPDKTEAKKINDTYFEPIHKAEAEKQRFINKYNEKIKQFNLNKYEAEAVQVLGEKKYNPDFKIEKVDLKTNNTILDRVNENIRNGKVDKVKVDNAIEVFRGIYDELFEIENNILRQNGYEEKKYRKGYFPHFIDAVPETKTEKVLNALGFKIDKRPLPTDIAGITEQFVPGKTWNKSALERKTNITDYNALKGFDTYISQAADNIFHTENIQKLRALENEIRYQYSDKGVQERIDNILNDETLFAEEKQDLIDKIFEQVQNPVPNLVTELRRYTNALANKKSEADRSIENKTGRAIYSTVNAIENRFGANAVGLNIGSAVTNFIPITQAYSQVSTKNMGRAMIDTVKSYVNSDGFVDNSTFLTNRLRQAEKLYKTPLEKISDKTSFLFNAIDEVTSNIVVRGKYLENIENGMSKSEAIKNADRFGANLMADRSKGSLPTLFEEKNPVTKMFTQFQLEVNNQYRYMFKDIRRDLRDKGIANIALAFVKMFVGSWLYNQLSEWATGRKPAFDPIDIIVSGYKDITDEDKKTFDKITSIGRNIGEDLPFVGSLIGGGRVPVDGALPDVANTAKAGIGLITGEMNSKKAFHTLGKEASKPLSYLLPPFGGAQLKKSTEAIETLKNGGSYGVDKKGEETLQIPVENPNAGDYIKAVVFGKYSLPTAKTYSERNYKSLNANQTKMYKEAKLPYKQLTEYIDAGLKKNEDKINYIKSKDMSTQQKWGIYKYDIFSNIERKEDKGSQLKDAEYITSHGVSKEEYINVYNKAQENDLDIPTANEYKEMKEKGINLSHYMDYKIAIKNERKKKVDAGELKEKQDLKDRDKIQILLNSQYSNLEKTSMYEEYIKSSKDEQYDVMKKTGININSYLKYKQQEFKSDKKDDGTLDGKTITNSKKKKEYEYVNSMEGVTYEQRLVLLGMKYKLNNKERGKVAKYINSLPNITKKEKMEILDKIQGFTVYKDGRITY